MDREWWHPTGDGNWLIDNLGDAKENLDALWEERNQLEKQKQKLIEALKQIVECDPSYTNPTDIAQQALDEVDKYG